MKYSPEEAKKMMIAFGIDVQGAAEIGDSNELEKLYQAARNANEAADYGAALRHYENISAKDPDSWEALFYSVILKTKSIKNGEISSAALNVMRCLDKVISLIKENVDGKDKQFENLRTVVIECKYIAAELLLGSENFAKLMKKGNNMMMLGGISGLLIGANASLDSFAQQVMRTQSITEILRKCAKCIENIFGLEEKSYRDLALDCLKMLLDIHYNIHLAYIGADGNEVLLECIHKIKKYEPEYKTPYQIEQEENKKKTQVVVMLQLRFMGHTIVRKCGHFVGSVIMCLRKLGMAGRSSKLIM